MLLSEKLKQDHECGDFGKALAGYSEEAKRLEDAIIWALGAGESFPLREDEQDAYWWRSELQKRAGLKWDGEKFIRA